MSSASVVSWNGRTAIYAGGDIEYQIDTGVYINCPDCGDSVPIEKAVKTGCNDPTYGCGRDAWAVRIRTKEDTDG